MSEPLLSARHLIKKYPYQSGLLRRTQGWVHAVDDVSLEIHPGETVGLVGESGCGKSTLAKLLIGLIPPDSGTILRQRNLSGQPIQFIFQSSASSLNPRMRAGDSIAEPLYLQRTNADNPKKQVEKLLEEVGLDPAWYDRFPHQLSGGQRQRVAIARALILKPSLILCDEPVASLDALVQRQILELFKQLQISRNIAYLFISHHLGTVASLAQRIHVMYLGRIIETAPAAELFRKPVHPYTQALLGSLRSPLDSSSELILGEPGSALQIPSGCRFHPRCPRAEARCSTEDPALQPRTDGRVSACHFA